MIPQLLIDLMGWLGGVVLLIAFGLNSMGRISAQSKVYQYMNLFAGITLIFNTYYYGAYPATFVNVVWVIIALIALWNIFRSPATQEPG